MKSLTSPGWLNLSFFQRFDINLGMVLKNGASCI